MNLLFFQLEQSWGDDVILVSNNEQDLRDHFLSRSYQEATFYNLDKSYGVCLLKDQNGERQQAKCFYIKKV